LAKRDTRVKYNPYIFYSSEMIFYLFHVICTTSFSMSSARPFSNGSAIMVILFLPITHIELQMRQTYLNQFVILSKNFYRSYFNKTGFLKGGVEIQKVCSSLFIGCFSKTLQGGCLHHSLAESHHRVSYLLRSQR